VDITERKQAEQALQASERKYSEAFRREREAAQQLRALDDMKNTFLEAVSHDLRTPLTSILGSAITLEQANMDLPQEDAVDLVRRIATNARKLERLLGDLLDLDRLQRGIVSPQRRPTDVGELIRRAVEETEERNGHDLTVDVEPFMVSLDAPKVERIVENLVTNALRHTPPGAEVWVRAVPKDGGLLLIVEDDGTGIPPELREEIFEPFRQAPGSATGHSPGVGIGLSLVGRFAALHGGRAWVEDRPGGGASFRVLLPDGPPAGTGGPGTASHPRTAEAGSKPKDPPARAASACARGSGARPARRRGAGVGHGQLVDRLRQVEDLVGERQKLLVLLFLLLDEL